MSRATAYKWWRRFVAEGEVGLIDRSSRPQRSPRRTSARVERQIETLRRRTKLGPVRIAVRLHMPASTVHRVLVRRQLNRLSMAQLDHGVTVGVDTYGLQSPSCPLREWQKVRKSVSTTRALTSTRQLLTSTQRVAHLLASV